MYGTRVLVLAADYDERPWSGVGRAVARQSRALADEGVGVHVLVADGAAVPAASDETVPVSRLSRARFPVDPRDFDWIHVHSLRLADLAVEIRRRFKCPLACTVHGWPHRESNTANASRWSVVLRRLIERCDRIVFLSEAEREFGLRICPSIEDRSATIGHGLAATQADRHDRTNGPIVFAGRWAWSKGVDLAAGVARRVAEGERAHFVFAGGHGEAAGTAAVARLASDFPTRCRVAGWMEGGRLAALFARAALVLVPSRYEPFGLVALEAMSRGAPVLAADEGGLREVVAAKAGGVRVSSRSTTAWVDAVLTLLDDPIEMARLSACGPEYVARHFSPRTMARRFVEEVYRV